MLLLREASVINTTVAQ